MNLESAAITLNKLGHHVRLCIFKTLVATDEKGVSVGELRLRVGVPASTLSHHLAELASIGLIKQTRRGRHLYCTAERERFSKLMKYLREDCIAHH
ncbi:ArsR/SmtB family transcription factor [Pseudomonas fluorescens]|uniref:ArsR/SmtB family transcription factor n=1 Tax=Pseudomonas fluorescens TaxID=294 RepID=UPI000CD2F5F8|nr:transcriptional regulator [Pseudomonas fluorescens]